MIIIKSQGGNLYFYDDRTGMIFPSSDLFNQIVKGSASVENLPEELSKDVEYYNKFVTKWKKLGAFSPNCLNAEETNPEKLREMILREGLTQLCLCLTEDCNLRCKYCIYSDNYAYTRGYSHRHMSFETAKKAIDLYFSLIEESKRYNPWREPVIGFYGGEPLLNFGVLKSCVEYAEEEYGDFKLNYTTTTNATLLNKEKADFLMQHGFSIAVSLDGPEEEHDRNRVYPNGRGSYKDIIRNIDYIIEKGYDKISSLTVFDWKTDFFKLEEFFSREDIPQLSFASMVDVDMGCKYYSQFTRKDFESFKERLRSAEEYYLEKVNFTPKERLSFFDVLIGQSAARDIFQNMVIVEPYPFLPCTGACIPGRKIFVDIEGNLNPCERVNHTIPIGDVAKGLDFKRIADIMSRYLEILKKNCKECGIKRLCSKCYCNFLNDKGLYCPENLCKNVENSKIKDLAFSLSLGEKAPDFFDTYTNAYYETLEGFRR